MSYSVKAVLDHRREKNDGSYPIKIKVYINGQKVLYSTEYSMTKEDWNTPRDINYKTKTEREKLKDINKIKSTLDSLVEDAENILIKEGVQNHKNFESAFFKEVNISNYRLSFWFGDYQKLLIQHNRPHSTVRNYELTLKSLESLQPNLHFQDITPDFLKEYDAWMRSRGRSKATIGIYLRNLRSIFNYVINTKKIIKADLYPFGKNKYVIKSKSSKKKSLDFEQIKQIEQFTCPAKGNLDFARDLWLFHYLLNGSNPKDICKLKYSDLDFKNKTFSYYRSKTEETETDLTPISGVLHEKAVQIIEKWGNSDQSDYVFPFFNEFSGVKYIDAKRERAVIAFLCRRINRNLKQIQNKLNLTVKLTIGIARHSFARRLSNAYSIIDIGEQMGHQSTKTTENYINSLDYQKKKAMSGSLL